MRGGVGALTSVGPSGSRVQDVLVSLGLIFRGSVVSVQVRREKRPVSVGRSL